MRDFTSQKENIEKYRTPKMQLLECNETLGLLKNENKNGNPYIILAENFELYKQGKIEEHADWYFFKYLESIGNKDQYFFSIGNEEITVPIKVLEPYIKIGSNERVIDPQWHLMVSYYAYIDATYNHDNNKFAKKIKEMPDHPSGRFGYRCNSLLKWTEEGF